MKFSIFLTVLVIPLCSGFTSIKNGQLFYNDKRIFLSGVNAPWVAYGRDFGSGAYPHSKAQFEKYISDVSAAGGNAVRIWIFIDGQWAPKFDANGFATGADVPSLIAEIGQLLDFAESRNVFVIPCLWNLAVKPAQMLHLYKDEAKLNTYIDKVLKPLVIGLKGKKALAAWDIINEPIGSITQGIKDPNPCWDTSILVGSGADWAATHLTMREVMKFVNFQADAIKSVDPKALITLGDGEQTSSTLCGKNCREYWSDHCLVSTGGRLKGTIDIYQMHSYIWNGKFPATSPMLIPAGNYKSSKPILIGEMAVKCSESKDAKQCYGHAYNSGYIGILSWGYDGLGDCSDGHVADPGMSSLRNAVNNGAVSIKIA